MIEAESVNSTSEPELKQTPLDDLMTLLKNGDGYLVAFTIFVNGNLRHHLITKNFKNEDMLKSIAASEKLVVEQLRSL